MKYIWHDGAWREAIRVVAPSVFPAIHRDYMSVGYHPSTGEATDSKSRWRRLNKEHGFTEMGTDTPTERKRTHAPAVRKQDIAEAMNMLKNGYKPDPVPGLHDGDFADADARVL